MDESVVKHLEQQQIGTLKLSDAIRAGHDQIKESRSCYLEDGCGCAIGAAAYALGYRGDNDHCDYWLMKRFPAIQRELFKEISDHHYYKRMNRLEIADWLEAQGY